MDEHLPDFVKDELKAAMGKCLETEGKSLHWYFISGLIFINLEISDFPRYLGPKVDAKAADCSSFLPLSMCAHMAFMNVS